MVRSKRKTLALTIDRQGQLQVRAPLKIEKAVIEDFIRRKAAWIARKREQVTTDIEKRRPLTLVEGETVSFLGKEYIVRRGGVAAVAMAGDFIRIPENMWVAGFEDWLRKEAAVFIGGRVDHFSRLMGLSYTSVKMSAAKRRWGSCGPKNTLNFAWPLVMCPPPVIDYVVVHELSHIAHKNHGPHFWRQVAAVLPRYKEYRGWLQNNSYILEIVS